MDKYQKFSLFLLFFVALGLIFLRLNKPSLSPTATQSTAVPQNSELTVTSSEQKQTFDVSSFVGKTALEATEQMVKVETEGKGVNSFVTSINGRKADTNKNEFWELVINGSPAQVGAGSYQIKSGDILEWHIGNY